ncbi:MAG: DUF1127 domain-containing protein [Rhodospirillales bacterium]|nr:DUF1127 domain-containing protein [Rhodospirillales bacterium]
MNGATCYSGQPSTVPLSQARRGSGGNVHAQDVLIRALDTVLAWQDRVRERRRLGTLDERLLHDIGVDRASADIEALKPFWRR